MVDKKQKASKAVKKSMERVLVSVHPSRLSHAKWYLLGMAFIVLWASVWFDLAGNISYFSVISQYKIYSLIFLGGGVLLFIYSELSSIRENYKLTNFRIVHSQGLIGTHESTIEYEMISHYTIRQTTLEKIFNIGTVEINLIGRGTGSVFYLKKIPKIRKVKKILKGRIFATGKSKFL